MNNEVSFGPGAEVTEFTLKGSLVCVSHSMTDDKLNSVTRVLTVFTFVWRSFKVTLHVFVVLSVPLTFEVTELTNIGLVLFVDSREVLFKSRC